jgi:PAS domain S-box-containing protein
VGGRVEPILDVLPVPLLLVEPVSAEILFANAAARGVIDPGEPRLYDQAGMPLAPDASPLRRVARGETLSKVQLDWETREGLRTVLVSGTTLTVGARRVGVVTFEDVTHLESGRRRASVLADELEVMLDGVADAITVQSPDHRLIYANAAAARFFGLPRGRGIKTFSTEAYLAGFDVLDDTGKPLDVDRLPGRMALAGLDPEPIITRSVDRATGQVRWSRLKSTGVRDPDGGVRLAINLVEDITELKRSEESQRFLAEASRRLASSALDYARTLALVADLAVPFLGAACEVALDELEAAPEVAEVLRTGVARLEPRRMIVPMGAAGRVLGAIALTGDGRVYDQQDVLTAEDFGLRVGAALENARLYAAASEIARTLQSALLPPHLPDIPGAALSAAYHPAWQGLEVGGDFYDVFTTGQGHWYLVIGDVCGKGAEAAAVTALARYTLRTAAARLRSPAAILHWVGEAMLNQDAARGRYCTIACAHIDLASRRLTVACGGHPLPVLRRATGAVELVGAPGTLLGLLPDPELPEREVELAAGDALVLYTDGLTEARAPFGMWGEPELLAAVAAAPVDGAVGLVDSLVAAALGDRAAPRDDLAVLALKLG